MLRVHASRFALLGLLSFFITASVGSAQTLRISTQEGEYRSGKDRFLSVTQMDSQIPRSGTFLELPLNPADPSRGNFDLYYRLSQNFDRQKPTVLFFTGGPGGSTDFTNFNENLREFNFIYLDQRGTSFSHLRTLEQMLDPANFSSELIARDAEALRAHLGLDQITVYGASYGTVPATIYGSLFPNHTRAVILEGVIFDGTPDLWAPAYRNKQIQAYYDGLSAESKQKIQRLTDTGQLPNTWFSHLVRNTMYQPYFAAEADKRLADLWSVPEKDAIASVLQFASNNFIFEDSTLFGAYMFLQIACQELSAGDPTSAWDSVIVNGHLQPQADPAFRQACLQVPGMQSQMKRTYSSTRYPLSVPVTYFEGTTDGATAPPNAMKHFKQVARSRAQLVYVVNGGHTAVAECLAAEANEATNAKCQARPELAQLFARAILGQNIDAKLLAAASKQNRWVKASRLRSIIPKK